MALEPGPASIGVAWLEPTTGEFFAAEWDGPARFDRLRDEIGATRPREILARREAELPPWLSDPAEPEGAIPRAPVEDRAFDPERARRELLAHFGVVEPGGVRLRGAAPGDRRRRRRPALRPRDAEARPRPRHDPRHPRRPGRARPRRAHPAQPRARREPGRRRAARHPARRPRPHPLRDGRPPPARVDPAPPRRARAHPGPARRGRGAGLPGPRPRAPARGALPGPGPRPHPRSGHPRHGRAPRPRRPRPVPARAARGGRGARASASRPWSACRPRTSTRPSTSRTTSPGPWWTTLPRSCVRAGSSVTASTPTSTGSAPRAAAGGPPSPRSRSASACAPGSRSLKVRFNRVFGYYIEVSRSNLGLVPADYVRKQTIAGGERFVTPELKEYEDRVLRADELILERETRIFEDLRARLAAGRSARPADIARGRLPRRPGLAGRGRHPLRLREAPPVPRGRAHLHRGPPPDHGARPGRALRGERPRHGRPGAAALRPDRPQHGRQVHLPAAGGPRRR